jgi:hypothetical protein
MEVQSPSAKWEDETVRSYIICSVRQILLEMTRVGGTRDEMTGSSSDDWIY